MNGSGQPPGIGQPPSEPPRVPTVPEPPGFGAPTHPPTAGTSGSAAGNRVAEGTATDRPRPGIPSLLGAVAGLLLAASLAQFLSTLSGDRRRLAGVAISLAFEIAGVGLVWLARNRRTATAGVTLSAVGLVPLVFHLFVDPADPDKYIGSVGDFTNTATSVLAVLTILWLAAYLVGPGRRYAIYLGGALVAIWLIALIQIVEDPISKFSDQVSVFGATSSFEEVDAVDSFDDSSFTGTTGFDDSSFSEDFGTSDGFESSNDDFDFDGTLSGEFETTSDGGAVLLDEGGDDDTATKLGIASLLIGGAYLAFGALGDRRGDARMATAFFAVSIPILHVAVLMLSESIEAVGAGLLAVGLGAAGIWLGGLGARRFTSWTGVWAVTIGIIVVVDDATGSRSSLSAVVLMVLGLGVAVLGLIEEGSPPWGRRPQDSPAPLPAAGPPSSASGATPPFAAGPDAPSPFAPPAGTAPWGTPPAVAPPSPGSTEPPTQPPVRPPTDQWAPPPGS